jgi:hypothetical protein
MSSVLLARLCAPESLPSVPPNLYSWSPGLGCLTDMLHVHVNLEESKTEQVSYLRDLLGHLLCKCLGDLA